MAQVGRTNRHLIAECSYIGITMIHGLHKAKAPTQSGKISQLRSASGSGVHTQCGAAHKHQDCTDGNAAVSSHVRKREPS